MADDTTDQETNKPFHVTTTMLQCPFCPRAFPIDVGWVNHEAPVIHISTPEMLNHFRIKHLDIVK